MEQIENKTILNDTISFLDSKFGPQATGTQLTQSILSEIQNGRKNFKPYIPNKMCQYPNPARFDDFSTGEGLGVMSLQPAIDGLNNFKVNIIKQIQTKFEAMGPENAKDVKLAAGVVTLIKEIYDAAKCFTQVVGRINQLVNSYINAVNIMIVDVVDKINILEEQINSLKYMLLNPTNINYLTALCGKELVSSLQSATGIFDILGAVVELQNAITEAEVQIDTLKNTDKKLRLHAKAALTLLQGRINSFIYYQSLKGSLDFNLSSANGSFIQDDFLDNFTFVDVKESSFNWSITNSGAIYDCNIDDDINLIPRLNSAMKNVESNSFKSVLIDSRTEEGYIVVPDDTVGLVSAGLDPRLGSDVNIIFDLSINNGETIIRSIANGAQLGPNDNVMVKCLGYYLNYGKESFDYNKMIDNGNGTFNLYITDITKISDILIGSSYNFMNPLTMLPWQFKWIRNSDSKESLYPVLFKIIDVTASYIVVKILQNSDLLVSDFIPNAVTSDYTFNIDPTFTTPPGGLDTQLILDSNTGDILSIPSIDPLHPSVTFNTVTLNKYNLNSSVNKVPHSGEKIRCHNWSLTASLSGDPFKLKKAQFSSQFPSETIYLFFLKAKWGFIPIQA